MQDKDFILSIALCHLPIKLAQVPTKPACKCLLAAMLGSSTPPLTATTSTSYNAASYPLPPFFPRICLFIFLCFPDIRLPRCTCPTTTPVSLMQPAQIRGPNRGGERETFFKKRETRFMTLLDLLALDGRFPDTSPSCCLLLLLRDVVPNGQRAAWGCFDILVVAIRRATPTNLCPISDLIEIVNPLPPTKYINSTPRVLL